MKCYRVNTLWHWRRKPSILTVNLDNLMVLKEETHETMRIIVDTHKKREEYRDAFCVDAFYRTYGQQVKVVRGRKVPRGTVGECFWMGYKPYGYISYQANADEVIKAIRIGIRDESGEVYWTTLNNVEVIPEVEPLTAIPEHLYRFRRKFLDLPALYGEDETDEMKVVREELEKLHKEYAVKRELVENSRLHREEVKEKFGKDSPEVDAVWDKYEGIYDACSKLEQELDAATSKYFKLWAREIRPLAEISTKRAVCKN